MLEEQSELTEETPRAQSEGLLLGDRLDQSGRVWALRHLGRSSVSWGSKGRHGPGPAHRTQCRMTQCPLWGGWHSAPELGLSW